MCGHWKVLDRKGSFPNSPPLLIKHEVESSSYKVYLSDLVHVWTEHLTAKDIRRRALNSNTSIDPSEDQGQMRQFLQCVDDALSQKSGTSLALEYSVSSAEHLLLRTHTPLPGGLEPLKWLVEMKMDSTFGLTRELIVPLLYQQSVQRARFSSLYQQLKEKDNVIDKLIDTLIADGGSLTKVFPGGTPSKSALKLNPREALSRHARGLSKFHERPWEDDLSSSVTQPSSLDSLVESACVQDLAEVPQALTFPEYSEWWLNPTENETKKSNESQAEPSTLTQKSLDTNEESQFQTQPTPSKPHLPATKATTAAPSLPAATSPISDASTTDDDNNANDTDDPVSPLENLPTEAGNPNLISRPKSYPPTDPPSRTTSPPEASKPNPSQAPPNIHSTATTAQKPKLGKIGGKPQAPPPRHEQPPSVLPQGQSHPLAPQIQKKPTLSSPSPPPETQPDINKHPNPTPPTPSEAETEKARADRNRSEIKRTLDAKAAGTGKKKVRRF